MYEVDQAMRLYAGTDINKWDDQIDEQNTARLKEIINEIGWPTISKVGKEGEMHAWLLAQHADHDLTFQKRCLELIKAEPEDEIDKSYIAFLDDRIAVAESRPQLYGTQFFHDNNNMLKPRPILEPEKINERRRKMGLESFGKYENMMHSQHG